MSQWFEDCSLDVWEFIENTYPLGCQNPPPSNSDQKDYPSIFRQTGDLYKSEDVPRGTGESSQPATKLMVPPKIPCCNCWWMNQEIRGRENQFFFGWQLKSQILYRVLIHPRWLAQILYRVFIHPRCFFSGISFHSISTKWGYCRFCGPCNCWQTARPFLGIVDRGGFHGGEVFHYCWWWSNAASPLMSTKTW